MYSLVLNMHGLKQKVFKIENYLLQLMALTMSQYKKRKGIIIVNA